MSKPSRRPSRERRPKKKRDRELKRQIEQLPVVVTFYAEGGRARANLDSDGCWARIRGDDEPTVPRPGKCAPCRSGPQPDRRLTDRSPHWDR